MIHPGRATPPLLVVAALCGVTVGTRAAPAADEVRALRVTRSSLSSPAAIERLVSGASATRFNTLFVQVSGRGDTYFTIGLELRAAALAAQPDDFDPLAVTDARARAAGAVDGRHLDYIRYPGPTFDYCLETISAFEADTLPHRAPADRARVSAFEAIDPLASPEAFPGEWRRFRQSRLTALVTRPYSTAKRARPGIMVTAAVLPDSDAALADKLQDWRTWAENGFIDALCPISDTTDPKVFQSQIAEVRALAGFKPVWAGVDAYRLSSRDTINTIAIARRVGVDGVIFFSSDSLVTLPNGPEFLAAVGEAAFSGS